MWSFDVFFCRPENANSMIQQSSSWRRFQTQCRSRGVTVIQLRQLFNSLRPSDAIWRQWSWTTLAQVMACCLTAPSHYLNQCWLTIRGVLWHTSESSFAGIAQGIDSGYEFEKDILKNIFKSPRGQWVKWIRILYPWRSEWCLPEMKTAVETWTQSQFHFWSNWSKNDADNVTLIG